MSEASSTQKIIKARESVFKDIPARQRLSMLFDTDSFVEIYGFSAVEGNPCGVVCGYGAVMGSPVFAFAQDSTENSGAVGAVHAAKIVQVYENALKTGVPVVGIYDSRGARITEGSVALNAYGDILRKMNNLSGVVPQISVVLGVCSGASAMLAGCADFVVMDSKAQLLLTPQVDGANDNSGAENAAKSGVASVVAHGDAKAFEVVRKMLSYLPLNNLSALPQVNFAQSDNIEAALSAACDDMENANLNSIVSAICDKDSAIEMLASFGTNVYTSIATMGGFACGIVCCDGEKLTSDSCSKIAKLVSVCDSFQIPVVTLVNTAGVSSVDGCAMVRDISRLAHVYAEATTAKIAIITGKAYGSAYVALASRAANSDYTIAWPSAIISALEPQTAVAFLHSDEITKDKPRQVVEKEYIENQASAFVAASQGSIDDVIDPKVTRQAVLAALDLLSAKRVSTHPKKHSNIPM